MEPEQLRVPFGEPGAASATPFLRWAGGKQTFAARYGHLLPPGENKYIEPFLGGGSVFFYLMRTHAGFKETYLGDINSQLITCYMAIRDDPLAVSEALHRICSEFEASKDPSAFYYQQRELHNNQAVAYSAARFIFLNRTCWNGLFRVNSKGEFNVPFGRPPKRRKRTFPSEKQLRAVSEALGTSVLRVAGWESLCENATKGDFVFLDPPYFSDCAGTAKYNIKPFDEDDHVRLAELLVEFENSGINYVLTNSAEYEMMRLYHDMGLRTVTISAPRAINSKLSSRSSIPELLVTNIPQITQEEIDLSW